MLTVAIAEASDQTPADHPALIYQVKQQHGIAAARRVTDWLGLLNRRDYQSEMEVVRAVNHFFNRRHFQPDHTTWQSSDYWATPVEFLIRNSGDCEDFALAKYLSLRTLGISANRLRLIYAQAGSRNEPHIVLAYYPSDTSEALILDNLTHRIQWASDRRELEPVVGFNTEGYWLQSRHTPLPSSQVPERVQHWRQLLTQVSLLSMQVRQPPSNTARSTASGR